MKIYYFKCFPNGAGRGCGDVEDKDFDKRVSEDPANVYIIVNLDDYRMLMGRPDRFCLKDGKVQPKTALALAASKAIFKGDGKDSTIITWEPLDRALNLKINGHAISSNPHENGLVIQWDQEQRLRLSIDDVEFWGEIEVRAT